MNILSQGRRDEVDRGGPHHSYERSCEIHDDTPYKSQETTSHQEAVDMDLEMMTDDK